MRPKAIFRRKKLKENNIQSFKMKQGYWWWFVYIIHERFWSRSAFNSSNHLSLWQGKADTAAWDNVRTVVSGRGMGWCKKEGLLRVGRNELICERCFRRDAVVSVYVCGLQEVIRCADERSVSQLLSQLH